MSPLNYLYATILSVVLAHWFYRLAIQHVDDPDSPQKLGVYLGFILVGFMISIPLMTWLGTPGLGLVHWWSYIIPSDQLPSRIFFWIFTLSLMVVFMFGICLSEGWTNFTDGSNQDSFCIVLLCFAFFGVVGFYLGYLFCLTLFQNLMRLA